MAGLRGRARRAGHEEPGAGANIANEAVTSWGAPNDPPARLRRGPPANAADHLNYGRGLQESGGEEKAAVEENSGSAEVKDAKKDAKNKESAQVSGEEGGHGSEEEGGEAATSAEEEKADAEEGIATEGGAEHAGKGADEIEVDPSGGEPEGSEPAEPRGDAKKDAAEAAAEERAGEGEAIKAPAATSGDKMEGGAGESRSEPEDEEAAEDESGDYKTEAGEEPNDEAEKEAGTKEEAEEEAEGAGADGTENVGGHAEEGSGASGEGGEEGEAPEGLKGEAGGKTGPSEAEGSKDAPEPSAETAEAKGGDAAEESGEDEAVEEGKAAKEGEGSEASKNETEGEKNSPSKDEPEEAAPVEVATVEVAGESDEEGVDEGAASGDKEEPEVEVAPALEEPEGEKAAGADEDEEESTAESGEDEAADEGKGEESADEDEEVTAKGKVQPEKSDDQGEEPEADASKEALDLETEGEVQPKGIEKGTGGDNAGDESVEAEQVDANALEKEPSSSSDKASKDKAAGSDNGGGEIAAESKPNDSKTAAQKTDEQIEEEIEEEIEEALEKGELDESTAEELEEEMEEALEEGMGEAFKEELDGALDREAAVGSDDGAEAPAPSADDQENGAVDAGASTKSGVATIGLSHDKAGSSILVDDPPAVGEVPVSGTQTAEEANFAFDNLDCQDEAAGFPRHPGTASNDRVPCEDMPKETCGTVLFSVDASAPAPNVRVEEEVAEKSPTDLAEKAKDDERRRLAWSEDGVDEETEKDDAPSLSSEKVVLASDTIVVTYGSRYCPATCDALPQCARARDHFHPRGKGEQVEDDASEEKPSDDRGEVAASAEEAGGEEEGVSANGVEEDTKLKKPDDESPVSSGDEVASGGDAEDGAEETTSDGKEASEDGEETTSDGKESPEGGEETVSEGKVADEPNCDDDKGFLYKDKPEMTCEYIGKFKPDKCSKLHDGEKVGVMSCPVSCGMVEECEATKLGVSPPREGETASSEGGEGPVPDVAAGAEGEDVEGSEDESGDSGDIAVPAEPAGDALDVAEIVCEDDADFRYKDKPEMTCAYIGKYKPDKCLKLHNGEAVGAASCPVSCKMEKECKAMYSLRGGEEANEEAVSGVSGDIAEGVEDVDSDADAEEVEEVDGEADVIGGEGGDEDGSKDANVEDADWGVESQSEDLGDVDAVETVVHEGEASPKSEDNDVEAEPAVEVEAEPSLDGDKFVNANGWSPDSEDAPLPAVSSEDTPSCKDDASFRYKDREEETCAFIGEKKPERCSKLHNGVEIGISSCPESCGMVAKCLGEDVATGDVEADNPEEGDGGDAVGTKSMADEFEEEWDGGSNFGSFNSADEDVGTMGGYKGTDSLDQDTDDMRYDTGDVGYNNDWENNNESALSWDGNNGGGAETEEMANWEKNNEEEQSSWDGNWNEDQPTWEANPETTWEANPESVESFNPVQDVGSLDNAAPLSAPATNSFNDEAPSTADDWLDDDDGFHPGLFILLLGLLGLLVYRKSRDQREAERASRGGYQPVTRDQHSHRW
ncbi:hypothetical protein ACHAXT_002620 [Thalassiosira profunda]